MTYGRGEDGLRQIMLAIQAGAVEAHCVFDKESLTITSAADGGGDVLWADDACDEGDLIVVLLRVLGIKARRA